eukprot:760958-Hanusia_phi.AAC.1
MTTFDPVLPPSQLVPVANGDFEEVGSPSYPYSCPSSPPISSSSCSLFFSSPVSFLRFSSFPRLQLSPSLLLLLLPPPSSLLLSRYLSSSSLPCFHTLFPPHPLLSSFLPASHPAPKDVVSCFNGVEFRAVSGWDVSPPSLQPRCYGSGVI